jgi:hypothetical protein
MLPEPLGLVHVPLALRKADVPPVGADSVVPWSLAIVGVVAVPPRSPSSWIRPGVEELALPGVGILPHAAVVLLDAMRAWPDIGAVAPLIETLVVALRSPEALGTVGAVAVPARSPANWTIPGLPVVALFTVVELTVAGIH